MNKSAIFDADSWREIGVTLLRNKTRTFMTAFGIFWGTAILAICFGGGRGFRGMMTRNFQGFATNMGFVSPMNTTVSYLGYNKGRAWSIRELDVSEIRRTIPEVERLSTLQQVPSTAKYGMKSVGTSGVGVDPDYWHVMTPVLYAGRLLNESDQAGTRKVAVIGKTVAGQLFGEEDAIGKYIQLDGLFYLVVGVAGQKQDASIGRRIDEGVWIPSSTFRRAYNYGDSFGFVVYTSCKGMTPTDLAPRIARILRRNHAISPEDDGAINFGDISQMFEMVDNVFSGIDLLMLFVGMGTLLAGVIGVGNIMWIIVKERTSEIGIRRAIGARPSDVIIQVLSESMVLTNIAGLAGVTFAAIVLGVVDHFTFDEWFGKAGFELSFGAAIGILVVFLVLGTCAGLIPALKAMNIKPVEAMNQK